MAGRPTSWSRITDANTLRFAKEVISWVESIIPDPVKGALKDFQAMALTGGKDTALHYHDSDRDLENATGLLPASKVTGIEQVAIPNNTGATGSGLIIIRNNAGLPEWQFPQTVDCGSFADHFGPLAATPLLIDCGGINA